MEKCLPNQGKEGSLMGSNIRYYLLTLMVLITASIACAANQALPELTPAEKILLLKLSAEQGNIESQWALGSAYANAKPPMQNLAEAEKWTRKAAEQGHVGAMVDMAKLNAFYKLDKDEETAAFWYQKAANQGHPEAQFMIGSYHFSGLGGVQQDNVKASMWWILSAAKDHPMAKIMLEKSTDKINQKQIDEARQLARDWKPVK
jgi:uncharacterized protein